MSDDDGLDLGGEDVGGADGGKKRGGPGFLPNLLKFIAIGLGALIFIVAVVVITVNIMSGKSESQTSMDPTSEYIGTRPQYATFTLIGQINTRTRDLTHAVVVDMLIEYDLNNNAAQTELTGRVNQLRDFTRNYFAGKYSNELEPENEQKLKQEIREILNTRYLDTAKVRNILFNKLDVMEL
ncbi:MAG: flagellar basal body-associated FliL family protein [Spirochaetaceae bacterium]|nr:flagellar basal body-associated FliL family protein [Spirochaetaceae bacterium]